MTLDTVAATFSAKREGAGYRAKCPAHDDKKASLMIHDGRTAVVLKCHAGCATADVLAAVGLTFADLSVNGQRSAGASSFSPIVATYNYCDITGAVRYRKQRTAAKHFWFQQPTTVGGWTKGKPKGLSLLYRLPELRGQTFAFITEGEQDTDRLRRLELAATTNDAGASDEGQAPKWTPALTAQLQEIGVRSVACLPDNDGPGREHMLAVARCCHRAGLEARIVPLPDLPEKGDVSDYLSAGHTVADLFACVEAAPVYAPDPSERATTTTAPAVEPLPAFLARLESRRDLEWLAPELIPQQGIVLWHGQPRDLKSFCAVELGLALASGRQVFGCPRFPVQRPVRVAYFTEEDGEHLLAVRLRWLTAKTGVPEHYYVFSRKGFSFDDDTARALILTQITACQPDVVQFDPLRSYTGLSDKGPADFRPIAAFLRHIQATTTAKAVQLIHHDVKPTAATGGSDRRRSQNASGGGIFSISDCPVSFSKLDWNRVAVFPEDYKLSADPKPFDVTFDTTPQPDDDAPRFDTWITPIARTQDEHTIADAAISRKVLLFLRAHVGQWFTNDAICAGAQLRKQSLESILERLIDEDKVQFATGQTAKAMGRRETAKLYRVSPPEAGGD